MPSGEKKKKRSFWTLSRKPNLQTTSSRTLKINAVLNFFSVLGVITAFRFYSWHSTNHSSLVFILHQELLLSRLCNRCKAIVLKQRHPNLPINLTAPWHHGYHSVQKQSWKHGTDPPCTVWNHCLGYQTQQIRHSQSVTWYKFFLHPMQGVLEWEEPGCHHVLEILTVIKYWLQVSQASKLHKIWEMEALLRWKQNQIKSCICHTQQHL